MKNTSADRESQKWYEKASKKHFSPEGKISDAKIKADKKNKHSADDKTRASDRTTEQAPFKKEYSSSKTTRASTASRHAHDETRRTTEETHRSSSPLHTSLTELAPLFNTAALSREATEALSCFDKIISSSHPLSSKQRVLLPQQIRSLSHNLTDERSDRRLGYMNQTTTLSAYCYYYEWWNLVRLTRLFANLPAQSFTLADDAICLDIGSGPLTVPTALFLARPDLRKKHLTWYCLDLSSAALAEGENIFLSTAAHLQCEPWKIVRVKGEIGTPIKEKASLVTCANVFNEIVEDFTMPPDYLAKKYCEKILSYVTTSNSKTNDSQIAQADKSSSSHEDTPVSKKSDTPTHVLVIEPGVPKSARFISLLRDALIRRDFTPDAPCTHCSECPMDGKKGGKWCNFAFSTDDAPAALRKLSEQAQLPKERAVLSFVMATRSAEATVSNRTRTLQETNDTEATRAPQAAVSNTTSLSFRVASDPIRLPGERTGYYACSERGLLLVVTHKRLASGECFKMKTPDRMDHIDAKSGAIVVEIG